MAENKVYKQSNRSFRIYKSRDKRQIFVMGKGQKNMQKFRPSFNVNKLSP